MLHTVWRIFWLSVWVSAGAGVEGTSEMASAGDAGGGITLPTFSPSVTAERLVGRPVSWNSDRARRCDACGVGPGGVPDGGFPVTVYSRGQGK